MQPALEPSPSTLARARGSLDLLQINAGILELGGWILHPEVACDQFAIFIDGVPWGEGTITPRDDVAAMMPHLPHARTCGFLFRGPPPEISAPFVELTVEARTAVQPRAAFSWHARLRERSSATPAEHLRVRVSGNRLADIFDRVGVDAAVTMLRTLQARPDFSRTPAVLDWGCGSGRVATVIAEMFPEVHLTGCDLDAEAIAWCNQHIRPGAFHATNPFPPLPFPDGAFDAVIACSVMTHLESRVQERWLAEIRRILKPGGWFLPTVQGRFAAAFVPGMLDRLKGRGIFEEVKDRTLDGIAPRNYYRIVFQTPEFTRARWSRHFEVVDYLEGGVAAFHDLVVLRR